MQVQHVPPLFPLLWPYIFKALIGTVVAGVGTLMLWPIRKAREEWKTLKENTAAILQELSHQRSNCLATLQNQGDRQIELLEKAVSTLDNIHVSQAEMTGFFKAQALRSSRARAKK